MEAGTYPQTPRCSIAVAELSLKERLQPALIDRLLDEERLLTVYELVFQRDELQRLAISERDLVAVIAAQGLSVGALGGEAVLPGSAAEILRLRFSAPHGRVGVAQLNELVLKSPGAPTGIRLKQLCEIEIRNVLNNTMEAAHQRYATARRLREYISRDLSTLLNAASLQMTVDLGSVPHVQRSVLNYGMPSVTGKAASSVNPDRMARVIEGVIRQFEPRLSKVRVAAETAGAGGNQHEISFRIDAELWGQPAPHQVVLRTHIDTESGHVRVNDAVGG